MPNEKNYIISTLCTKNDSYGVFFVEHSQGILGVKETLTTKIQNNIKYRV